MKGDRIMRFGNFKTEAQRIEVVYIFEGLESAAGSLDDGELTYSRPSLPSASTRS